MHPADELHHVRCQLRRLKAREAELRETLMAGLEAGDSAGERWRAKLRWRKVRRIDVACLPPEIRDDALYWRESELGHLLLEPVERVAAPPTRQRWIAVEPDSLIEACPSA